jgi:hypothetical protein
MKKLLSAMMLSMLFVAPVMADDQAAAPATDTSAAPAADQAAPAGDQSAPAAMTSKKMKAAKAPAGDAAKEAQIKKVFDEISADWAAGDAHKLASHWLLDGSLINPFGQDAWSRADVEKVAGGDLDAMKGSTQTFSDFKFTWILGGCALVDCTGTVSGLKAADGTAAPDKTFHVVSLVVQRGAKWEARAVRPYAYIPAPGSAAPAAAAPAADSSSTSSAAPAAVTDTLDKKDSK